MDFDAKLKYMTSLKEQGNTAFKQAFNLKRAEALYTKCVNTFPYEGALDDEQKKQVDGVKLSAMTNHTLCKVKSNDFSEQGVLGHSNAALAVDPKSVKALYYRGLAHSKMGHMANALSDFKAAAAIDPANKDVARELAALRAKNKAETDRERKAFGGFFGKVQLVSPEEEARAAKQAEDAALKKLQEDTDMNSDSDEADEEEIAAPNASSDNTGATDATATSTSDKEDAAASAQ
jgi:tetratricopeptide (TPR) repeat protein